MQHTVTAPFSGLSLGRFSLTIAPDSPDNPALTLRALCFRGGASDRDDLDPHCQHVTVTAKGGQTVAAFRVLVLPDPAQIGRSYSARFYDLQTLARLPFALLELGRFCLHPDWHDPDILRLSWAALTRLTDRHRVGLMFGCSSFAKADPALHLDALAHLARNHLAPPALAPVQTQQAVAFPALVADRPADSRRALAAMPPLLRTYLAMGGWVSDHAVIDHDLNTLHVFTGVEIARIPPARARLLRRLADGTGDSAIDLPAQPD